MARTTLPLLLCLLSAVVLVNLSSAAPTAQDKREAGRSHLREVLLSISKRWDPSAAGCGCTGYSAQCWGDASCHGTHGAASTCKVVCCGTQCT